MRKLKILKNFFFVLKLNKSVVFNYSVLLLFDTFLFPVKEWSLFYLLNFLAHSNRIFVIKTNKEILKFWHEIWFDLEAYH